MIYLTSDEAMLLNAIADYTTPSKLKAHRPPKDNFRAGVAPKELTEWMERIGEIRFFGLCAIVILDIEFDTPDDGLGVASTLFYYKKDEQ